MSKPKNQWVINLDKHMKKVGIIVVPIILILILAIFIPVIWTIIKILFYISVISGLIWVYYTKYKPKIEKKREKISEEGKKRREKLLGNVCENDYELGNMSDEEFKELEIDIKREHEEKEKKRKEVEMETRIILKTYQRYKKNFLITLDKEEKEYQINKWTKKIKDLVKSGHKQQDIIDHMFGKIMLTVKNPKNNEETNDKLNEITDALEEYHTDRLIRDEEQLETVIYEYLKHTFSEYDVQFQQTINGRRRVDIVIDSEIAIELKIADKRKNLDSLFAQIEWYKDSFDKLVLLILDLGYIQDLGEFKERFESKGAEVVILNKENISRFQRRNKNKRRYY